MFEHQLWSRVPTSIFFFHLSIIIWLLQKVLGMFIKCLPGLGNVLVEFCENRYVDDNDALQKKLAHIYRSRSNVVSTVSVPLWRYSKIL